MMEWERVGGDLTSSIIYFLGRSARKEKLSSWRKEFFEWRERDEGEYKEEKDDLDIKWMQSHDQKRKNLFMVMEKVRNVLLAQNWKGYIEWERYPSYKRKRMVILVHAEEQVATQPEGYETRNRSKERNYSICDDHTDRGAKFGKWRKKVSLPTLPFVKRGQSSWNNLKYLLMI